MLDPWVLPGDPHWALLERTNGGYAFDGALHILGAGGPHAFHRLAWHNRHDGWIKEYGGLGEGLVFFAENILGEQFAYAREGIVRWMPETGDRKLVAHDFDEWVRRILSDPDDLTARQLLRRWTEREGKIPYGRHLATFPPFVVDTGEERRLFRPIPAAENLAYHAWLARRIRDLPDGTPIEFDVPD